MAFIKLHGKGVDEGINILVNTAQIEYILADAGSIKFPDGDTFWTQETPEEILQLIKETENGKQKEYEGKHMTDKEIIEEMDSSPLIKKKYLDNGIVSYNFTRDAFYKQKWNELTCKARGLFVDSETGKIIARSYDKFFNEDQLTEEQLHKFEPPFDVSFKENGYLGLLSYNPKTDDFFIATKSVDYGDYKDWFKQILEDKKYLTNELKQYLKENNVTFVFEVIDPEHDSHIIEYKEKQVCLLDIIRNEFEFKPYSYDELCKVTSKFIINRKYMYYIECDCDINHTLSQLKDNDCEIEGYVIRDKNNRMLKVKLPYYKFWKKVRSYLERIINNKLNIEDIDTLKEDDRMKSVLRYAFDNYYSDMSLIDFRNEWEKKKIELA